MIAFVRMYTRLFATMIFVVFMFSLRLSAKILRPFSREHEQRCRRAVFRGCAKGVLSITGIRLEVRGAPPVGTFLLVSNHYSFLDVFILASQLGCVFVSRDDLAHWPLFGFIATEMDTIYINRDRLRDTLRVNERISDAMTAGYGVCMFPEGTVAQDGGVLPFRPALLEPAVQLKLPVHYASVRYGAPEGSPSAYDFAIWRDGTSFVGHYLDFAARPATNATVTFGSEPIRSDDRRLLAKQLWQAVTSQFEPMTAPEDS